MTTGSRAGPPVSLVGAGPGDPELLTLRAARRLQDAEVVLYDALVDPRVLALAARARCVDVGKRAGRHRFAQRAIERLMVRLFHRGERVVRLKGGDPFLFGRGGEEALALARAGVPFEIVPGLSSALSGPALCGIPVTSRGHSAGVLVVSGHDPQAAAALACGVSPAEVTVVVLMARRQRAALAALLCGSWPAGTPAAIVQSASLPTQALWRGTLADLAGGDAGPGPEIDPQAPALLVFGPTVDLAAVLGQAQEPVLVQARADVTIAAA